MSEIMIANTFRNYRIIFQITFCSKLFILFYQKLQDATFIKSLLLAVSLFKEGMMELLGISLEQMQAIVDYVVVVLPGYLQRTLSSANRYVKAKKP